MEIGAGSGALTRHLVAAGHRVTATDASPAMIALLRESVPGARAGLVRLPDDDLPEVDAVVDAVVGVGHPLNYVPDAAAVSRAWARIAAALRPGGVLAVDLCDLSYGLMRDGASPVARVTDDWALVTTFSRPAPDRFVRHITTFGRDGGGWIRSDERHDNVLVAAGAVPDLLARLGVDAQVRSGFGDERLAGGMVAVVGRKRA